MTEPHRRAASRSLEAALAALPDSLDNWPDVPRPNGEGPASGHTPVVEKKEHVQIARPHSRPRRHRRRRRRIRRATLTAAFALGGAFIVLAVDYLIFVHR